MTTLSVVIPTLNAAATLSRTLYGLGEWPAAQILVADGGSSDGTVPLAHVHGLQVVPAARGRGIQLAAGARAARGDWLLFLHADTMLAPGWRAPAEAFIDSSRASGLDHAGYFRFVLDDAGPAARRLERLVAWRCRRFGLPYGDQGLLISRRCYDAVGGFRPLPLMEDVDLARRLGQRRLGPIDHPAITSAARYRSAGYRRRSARNLLCLGLYFLGLPPRALARIYR
jgi:rSAM/selenodomain-associated transferase 2